MNTTDKIMAHVQHACATFKPSSLRVHDDVMASLRTEIEKLVRDAERYRWLRDEAWGGNNRSGPHLVVYRPGLIPSAVTELAEEAADAAIDTVMQEKQS